MANGVQQLLSQAVSLPKGGQGGSPLKDIGQSLGKFAREKLQREQKLADQIILMKGKAKIEEQILDARVKSNLDATKQLNEALGFNKQLNGGQQKPQQVRQPLRGFESEEQQMSIAGAEDLPPTARQFGTLQAQERQPTQDRQPPFISHLGRTMKNPMFVSPKSKADTSDLTGEQEVKARALARKISSVRGAERILPAITKLIKEGKTVDEVEDLIRFSSQSSEFTGVIRDTAQQILINSPAGVSDRTMDFIDDRLSKGDMSGVKSMFKRLVRTSADSADEKIVQGKERTVEFLGEIQNDLNSLQQSGVNTNIFTGTVEDMNSKIGRVKDPALRKVATKIKVAIMNYRRSMSGAAFSVPESAEYKDLFPSISRTSNFNSANIDALTEVMQGDLDNFYSLSMGRENYNKLFKNISAKTSTLSDGTKFTYEPIGQ